MLAANSLEFFLTMVRTATLENCLRGRADKIGAENITIEANATDEGHLYGSVSANDIVAALKARNVTDVTPDMVRLTGAIKELGLYTVKIHLASEIDADLKVWVVPTADANDAR